MHIQKNHSGSTI